MYYTSNKYRKEEKERRSSTPNQQSTSTNNVCGVEACFCQNDGWGSASHYSLIIVWWVDITSHKNIFISYKYYVQDKIQDIRYKTAIEGKQEEREAYLFVQA